MHTQDFPTIGDVAEELASIRWTPEPDASEEDSYLDVRLQVEEDGSWSIHTGNASYDTDHSGFWGAISLLPDMDDMREPAADLIEQAMDQASMSGDLEEDEDNPAESFRA